MFEALNDAEAACLPDEPKPLYVTTLETGVNFFPLKGESTIPAKLLCLGCVVMDECLDFAIDSGTEPGIWGAMSKRQRNLVKDARQNLSPEDADSVVAAEHQRDLTKGRSVLLNKRGPEIVRMFDRDYELAERARARRKKVTKVVNS